MLLKSIAVVALFFILESACDTKECKDNAVWCPLQPKSFCVDTAMQRICRKTCGGCLPSGCSGCQQRCNATTGECLCLEGFALLKNGRKCRDINECKKKSNPCAGTEKPSCVNFRGGYQCVVSKDLCKRKGFTNYYRSDSCCKLPNETKPFGQCGINAQNKGRVVGGKNTNTELWPWMVHISVGDDLCGGNILTERWILSAAHCFVSVKNIHRIKITIGMTNTTDYSETTRQLRRPNKVIIHSEYIFPKNDLALIELNEPLKWATSAAPICLPGGDKPKVGDKCFATGYGRLIEGGRFAEVLQEVELPVVDPLICKEAFRNETEVDVESMVCAGYITGGRDTCQGDSGGPFVCQRCDSCEFYLVGVTSFGVGCATAGKFGVYTNVAYYEEWIANITEVFNVTNRVCTKIEWGEWGSWSTCTKTCRSGQKFRSRICMNVKGENVGCIGNAMQNKTCNTHACLKPTWSEFTSWSSCNATCGSGEQSRSRKCLGGHESQPCKGEAISIRVCIQKCTKRPCGEWGGWKWTDCDRTCGKGKQIGIRKCFVESGCIGNATTTRECSNPEACLAPKSSNRWTEWSTCDNECGVRKSTRIHLKTRKIQTKDCKLRECPVWLEWGACSKTCGGGTRERRRLCKNSSSTNTCKESEILSEECNNNACP